MNAAVTKALVIHAPHDLRLEEQPVAPLGPKEDRKSVV